MSETHINIPKFAGKGRSISISIEQQQGNYPRSYLGTTHPSSSCSIHTPRSKQGYQPVYTSLPVDSSASVADCCPMHRPNQSHNQSQLPHSCIVHGTSPHVPITSKNQNARHDSAVLDSLQTHMETSLPHNISSNSNNTNSNKTNTCVHHAYNHNINNTPTYLNTKQYDCQRVQVDTIHPVPSSIRCYGTPQYCTMECIRRNNKLCAGKLQQYTKEAPAKSGNPEERAIYASQSSIGGTTLAPPISSPAFASKCSILPYRILSCTRGTVDTNIESILDVNTDTYWNTAQGTQHEQVIEQQYPSLLGHVQQYNKHTSSCNISIAYQTSKSLLPTLASLEKKTKDARWTQLRVQTQVCEGEAFSSIMEDRNMPRNRLSSYATGFQPAKYIRIRQAEGNPVGQYYLRCVGIPCEAAHITFPAEDLSLLLDKPKELLLDRAQDVQRADKRGYTHVYPIGGGSKEEARGEQNMYDLHRNKIACIHQIE